MTTYTDHADAIFDPLKPILGSVALETRDNLIALGEGDSSIPNSFRLDHVLLGTIPTTTGTTATLASLDLTDFKFIRCVISGVTLSTTDKLRIGGVTCSDDYIGAGYGLVDFEIATGIGSGMVTASDTPTGGSGFNTSYTSATTSIAFSLTGGAAFTAGSIKVYGVK